jgi:hypothetical protein
MADGVLFPWPDHLLQNHDAAKYTTVCDLFLKLLLGGQSP